MKGTSGIVLKPLSAGLRAAFLLIEEIMNGMMDSPEAGVRTDLRVAMVRLPNATAACESLNALIEAHDLRLELHDGSGCYELSLRQSATPRAGTDAIPALFLLVSAAGWTRVRK